MIRITSKLTEQQFTHLRRAAQNYDNRDWSLAPRDPLSFSHIARLSYVAKCATSEHDVARHMMVIAGATFEYEIV